MCTWSPRPSMLVAFLLALGCASASDAGEPAGLVAPATSARARHEVRADDGHTLVVWSRAPKEPRGVVLLVHGRTWSALPNFDLEGHSTLQAFADEGFAAYAVDLRGYGATARDPSGWNTPDRAVADLSATLASLRARHGVAPVLVGWSLGSLSAQLVAQREPGAVGALVLYGYARDVRRPPPADGPEVAEAPRTPNTAEAAASDFITPGSIDPATVDAYVAAALAADPIRAAWRSVGQLAALDPALVTVPTLVIHGVGDPVAPIDAMGALFAELGTSDKAWVVLPNSDHAAHLERAGPAFVHAITAFATQPRPVSSP